MSETPTTTFRAALVKAAKVVGLFLLIAAWFIVPAALAGEYIANWAFGVWLVIAAVLSVALFIWRDPEL